MSLNSSSQLVVAYQGSNWISVISSPVFWSVATYINLVVREDNGVINSSPTTIFPSTITVKFGIQQRIRIPMMDIDQDILKCRWSSNNSSIAPTMIDECADACQNLPGAQLYSTSSLDNNCTIIVNTTVIGYYIIALQIEDFLSSDPNATPLSSIPLQFLVRTVKVSCDRPTIIGELTNEATVNVQSNLLFSISIIAQVGCNNSIITSFLTIRAPTNQAGTSSIITLNSTHYSTKFIWTPTDDQIGEKEIFCTSAMDSNNLQSEPYCLNLMVISPTTTASTTTITGLVIYPMGNNPLLYFFFL